MDVTCTVYYHATSSVRRRVLASYVVELVLSAVGLSTKVTISGCSIPASSCVTGWDPFEGMNGDVLILIRILCEGVADLFFTF